MEKNPYTRTALIELEGIGASGKSTLFKMLGHYLESLDIRYASFKQPWFPSGLDEELDKDELLLKQVIYSPENVEDKDTMSLVEIQKGITRQRGRMFQQVLIPALEQGEIEVALLDRCWLSTAAYGPATTALTRKDIILWHEALPGFFIADLALFLDLSTKISMKRSKKRPEGQDIFEREQEVQEAIRQEYLRIAEEVNEPKIIIIDAALDEEPLFKAAKPHIDRVLLERGVVEGE